MYPNHKISYAIALGNINLMSNMVLPHENAILVLQPNLRFQDIQEDIILDLNTLAWRCRWTSQQYHQVNGYVQDHGVPKSGNVKKIEFENI